MRGRNNNNNNNNNNRGKGGPNPLTRSYESNGPDVKIRGNAQQIAEKYTTLARDATSSGDRVMAENYLQHAEHYNRIIAAAQASMPIQNFQQQRDDFDDEDGEDRDDMDFQGSGGEQPQQGGDGSGPQPVIEGMPAEVALNGEAGGDGQNQNRNRDNFRNRDGRDRNRDGRDRDGRDRNRDFQNRNGNGDYQRRDFNRRDDQRNDGQRNDGPRGYEQRSDDQRRRRPAIRSSRSSGCSCWRWPSRRTLRRKRPAMRARSSPTSWPRPRRSTPPSTTSARAARPTRPRRADSYDALKKYARDLTEARARGKLDPVIGRDEEIRRTIQVLSRRTKNNPVLIGEPGVGKTAIAEGWRCASSMATCRNPEGQAS
jgi:hypothetical protein